MKIHHHIKNHSKQLQAMEIHLHIKNHSKQLQAMELVSLKSIWT